MKKHIILAAFAAIVLPFAVSAQPQPKPAQPEPEYKFTVVKELLGLLDHQFP